jgi:hypothetical protein
MIYWYDDGCGVGWWVVLVVELKRGMKLGEGKGRREVHLSHVHVHMHMANCGIKTMATQDVETIHMH